MASRPILITQISDRRCTPHAATAWPRQNSRLHITRPGALAYGRVDTATALLRTISTLNGLSPRPDLVVISGDIADLALPEEYAHATKLLGALKVPFVAIPSNHDPAHSCAYAHATKLLGALKVPFVAIPGNHDRRPLMRESFPDSAYGGGAVTGAGLGAQ